MGIVCLAIGTPTSVLGVRYSMQTHDLKCLLSYSTVENMGIVLLLLGAGLIFGASGLPALAILVGLYHTLNHPAFKGLLFLVLLCHKMLDDWDVPMRSWVAWPT